MAFFARFNPGLSGAAPVIGWYDTDAFDYSSLPPPSELVKVSDADWSMHFAQPHGWLVEDGRLKEPESK